MGKSKRKRKLKEDDFKKKKLKVGKKLPMPDNVTKTSFKTRTINIVQRTKNQDGGHEEPVNFKHQTLKDLLSSCSHYNTQAREEALVGLKDLLEKHPSVLKENLNDIFQRVLGKITDIESGVRRAFLSLIWSSFRGLTEAEIAPFFPNVVAYLCSAMTHLNEGVRVDSMKFLDHCLHYYPQLLRNNSKNIILNFIDVISSEKGGRGASKNVGVSKVLSLKAKVNISQKFQLQVLTRLNHLLQVIFSVGNVGGVGGGYGDSSGGGSGGYDGSGGGRYGGYSGDRKLGSTNTSSDSTGKPTMNNTTINFGTTSNGGIGTLLIPSGTKEVFTRNEGSLVSEFSLKSSWAGSSSDVPTSSVDLLKNEVKLMEFIASLSPVLFEYWVECCPAEFAVNLIPVKKTSVSLQIMKEILEIFVTLIESLKKIISDQEVFFKFLKEKLFNHFYGHFVAVFPMSFTLQHSGSKKEKKDEGNQNISDVSMNLLICQLLSHFMHCAKQDDSKLPSWVTEVVHYLSGMLVCKASGKNLHTQITLTDIKSLTQLIKVFISIPVRYDDLKVKLLKSMFQLYEGTHVMSNTKKVLLQFLEDVLTTLPHYEISPTLKAILDDWLCSLLKIASNKILSSAVVHQVFSVCKLGILQMFPNIVTTVIKALPAIVRIENFQRFPEETQLLVIEVLYHLKQAPTRKLFEVLSIVSNSGTLSLKVFQYLLEVLHQISSPDVSNQVHVSAAPDFLSFLLSVLVGRPEKKLAQLQTPKKSTKNFQHPLTADNILVTEPKEYYSDIIRANQDVETLKKDWEYQVSTTNIICEYLQLSEYSGTLLDMMAPSLCKFFGKHPTLPLSVVYRLLCLVKTLLSLATENHKDESNHDDDLIAYTAKWCTLIWHFTVSQNSVSRDGEFFKAIMKGIKELLIKLCKISCGVLQTMLDLFLSYTSSTDTNCTLTCQVLTDMLKLLFKDVSEVGQLSVKRLYENLERVFNTGMIDSQIFSDFKYQVSVFSNM